MRNDQVLKTLISISPDDEKLLTDPDADDDGDVNDLCSRLRGCPGFIDA